MKNTGSKNSTSARGPRSSKAQKRAEKKLAALNVLIGTALVICLAVTAVFVLVAYVTGDMKYTDFTNDNSALGIDESTVNSLPKGIVNIALFGIDTRDKDVTDRKKPLSGNSDTVIILSVNTNDNTVKMTSVLRDSWIPAEGLKYGSYKLTDLYAKGGAELVIKTLNRNFGLDIKNYVSVSIRQLWAVIDILGGIDIQITEAERKQINYLADSEHFGIEEVESSGRVHLNGGQAMSYARIRNIDGDQYRALRQQKVLSCLFEKVKKMPKAEYPGILKKILSNVETSLGYSEILDFAPILAQSDLHIEATSVPGDDVVAKGGIFDDTRGGWVWKYDFDEAKTYIRKWIYGV